MHDYNKTGLQKCRKHDYEMITYCHANNALIICFPVGQPPGEPTGSQGKRFSFGISFFPAGEGSCLGLEKTSLDLGICSRRCDREGEKCLTWYHGRCEKMSKKRAKKIDTFLCYFCQRKVNIILWSDDERLKKVVMLWGYPGDGPTGKQMISA